MDRLFKLEVNAHQMCRTCLTRIRVLESLFCDEIIDGEIVSMMSVYETVFSEQISLNDPLPTKLCSCCKQNLIDAFLFKQKSAKSAKLLRKLLQLPEQNDGNEETDVKIKLSSKIVCNASTMTVSTRKPVQGEISGTVEANLEAMFTSLNEENNEFLEVLDDEHSKDIIHYVVTDKIADDLEDVDSLETIPDIQAKDCHLIHDLSINDVDATNAIDVTDADDTIDVDDTAEVIDAIEQIDDAIETEEQQYIEYALSECSTSDDPMHLEEGPKAKRPRKFNCRTCNCTVASNGMKEHIIDHEDFLPKVIGYSKFYRCNRCRHIYISSKDFEKHLTNGKICAVASADPEYCTDYQFLDDPMIGISENLHMISCSNIDNMFVCDCGRLTETLSELCEHYKCSHLMGPEELSQNGKDMCRLSHTCGICKTSFENLKEAVFHVYYHQKQFPCPVSPCRKMFMNSYNSLRRHIEREHITGLVFNCPYCKQEFMGYDRLRSHMKIDCSARQIKCKHCDQKFFQRQVLLMHERTHDSNKKFKCEYCPKSFAQSNDLKNHERVHTNERPYKCGHCDKSFKTISSRLDHLRTHDKDCMVECNVCNKKFKSFRILRGHMRLHMEKTNVCEICSKKFSRPYHLKIHMKTHQINIKKDLSS